MARHTTFRYRLHPTVNQEVLLSRHAGGARFAFNQCLRLHLDARSARRHDGSTEVPWTAFDLINLFNAWKKTEQAGRKIAVDSCGNAEVEVTGLAWRGELCQRVFEEAAVDLGRALKAWSDSRHGTGARRPVGHPRFKTKRSGTGSFRLRNTHSRTGTAAIRVGDTHPRSVTLPGIGTLRVHDDTRPLRRLLAKARARVLFATVTYRAGRWWVSLTVEAADLHSDRQHRHRNAGDSSGWVGVDRGLSAFVVTATSDAHHITRIIAPKPLTAGMRRQRRLAKAVTRKPKGSNNRKEAAARLARHHGSVANVRRHFLHQVSNELVKTHDRLVIEDLNVTGMLANRRLARAISDAGWAEFARMLTYKQAWRHGDLVVADRWFASSKTCSSCGTRKSVLPLADRRFECDHCGAAIDRDLNAAINLAVWAEQHHRADARARDPQAGGPANNAHRREGTGPHAVAGETGPEDVGTDVQTAPAARTDDAREGWCRQPTEVVRHALESPPCTSAS